MVGLKAGQEVERRREEKKTSHTAKCDWEDILHFRKY